MSASTTLSRDFLPGDILARDIPARDMVVRDMVAGDMFAGEWRGGGVMSDDGPRRRDVPLSVGVCAAGLIAASLGCWAVILYVASLI